MTHEEKINYMRIACGICSFGIDNRNLDKLVSIYELILEKKGASNVEDACRIEADVKSRHDVIERSNLLDKVSEKV